MKSFLFALTAIIVFSSHSFATDFCAAITTGDGDAGFYSNIECSDGQNNPKTISLGSKEAMAEMQNFTESKGYLLLPDFKSKNVYLFTKGETLEEQTKNHCVISRSYLVRKRLKFLQQKSAFYTIDCGNSSVSLEAMKMDSGNDTSGITDFMAKKGYDYVNSIQSSRYTISEGAYGRVGKMYFTSDRSGNDWLLFRQR